MSIYVISIIVLFLITYLPRNYCVMLSELFIFFQIAVMGRVGGDYDSYIARGELALRHPEIFYLNEPLNVVFSNLSIFIGIPVVSMYFISTSLISLYALRGQKNKLRYLFLYVIFLIPIAIGYLRQGLAMGCLLLLLTENSKKFKILAGVGAIISHPSAIMPNLLILISKNIKYSLVLISLTIIPLTFYSYNTVIHYFRSYTLQSPMHSAGYVYRAILYTILSTIFYNLIKNDYKKTKIIFDIFIIIALSTILFIFFGSTAADRILIYCVPFLVYLFASQSEDKWSYAIVAIGVFYFLIWIFFSPHAQANWRYSTIFNSA